MKQLDAVQIERLTEIKGQLLNLLSEALDLVRGTPEELAHLPNPNHGTAIGMQRVPAEPR